MTVDNKGEYADNYDSDDDDDDVGVGGDTDECYCSTV